MWSLSDGPPHNPGPGPPPHNHADESGREDYCAAKTLAFEYATKLLRTAGATDIPTKTRQVSDALQLETACRKRVWQSAKVEQRSSNSSITDSVKPAKLFSVYVDPTNGADNQVGSLERPMRTIEAALGVLRSLRSSVGNMTASELILRDGVHYVAETIELTAVDSNITIRGHEGESAVLSGGAPLTLSWRPVSGKPGVFVSSVPTTITEFATLFVGGRRAVRARSPDANPETQGLHTPNQTGYFSPATAHANGTFRQQCGAAMPTDLCPVVSGPSWQPGSVFTYGRFVGAADQNVGYAPPFEPYWCGKWIGLTAMSYTLGTANGEGVDSNSSAALDVRKATGPKMPLLPDGPSDAVLHMTRGTSDIWANFQWNVTRHDLSEHRLVLGKGGWQFPRGTTNGHWFVDNAGIEALTSAGEWYHDRQTHMLYMVGNGTSPPPSDVIVSQRPVVLRQRGSRSHPVRGVTLQDLTVAHAEVTYSLPYETPSGGGAFVGKPKTF